MRWKGGNGTTYGKGYSKSSVSASGRGFGAAAEVATNSRSAERVKQLVALGQPSEDAAQQTDGSFLLVLDDTSTLRWTKRPDGTWRKPEHKRAGWVGQLEQQTYVPGEGLLKSSAEMRNELPQEGRRASASAVGVAFSRLSVTDPPGISTRRASHADPEQLVAKSEQLEIPERISISFSDRPFGMTPSKLQEEHGYIIVKVSDGKPAAAACVRPGWRVATVSGMSCEGLELDTIQTMLKQAELPVLLEFDALPRNGDFCTCCQQVLVKGLFSRKMRTKPADKRRCERCIDIGAEIA